MQQLAPARRSGGLPQHGLVSLWDMLEIKGQSFHIAIASLAQLRAMVLSIAHLDKQTTLRKRIDDDVVAQVSDAFDALEEATEAIGAHVTRMAVQDLKEAVERKCTFESLVGGIESVQATLQRELSLSKIFGISAENVRLFDQTSRSLGPDVSKKLSAQLLEDLDEAGKCLALARPTASVFHLMRVMEAGLQMLGTKLGVPLVGESVWQVILDQVNKAIRAMPPKHPLTAKNAEIAAHLYNVKLAWRNEVMHPKETYTTDQARQVLGSVTAFLVALADVL